MPLDGYGRTIDYLRISVIDNCNLRCTYCMPLKGLSFTSSADLLSAAEIERVVRAAAGIGFRKIRLTGGEPTLRADIVEIVRRVAATPGIEDVAMTTNGILLPRLAGDLRAAGLSRVNIHVDTLDRDRIERLMRFSNIDEVWAGICAAEDAGFAPIKLNAVVVRGHNEGDVVELARLTIERGWHVRFIELMPLGSGECARVALGDFVPTGETRGRIEAALGELTELPRERAADESRNFRLPGGRGVVGFISPVSEPYCGSCNRMRLTADGRFHLCLLRDDELDVRSVLRGGGSDEKIAAVLRRAVETKPVGHELERGRSTRKRMMFQIGG